MSLTTTRLVDPWNRKRGAARSESKMHTDSRVARTGQPAIFTEKRASPSLNMKKFRSFKVPKFQSFKASKKVQSFKVSKKQSLNFWSLELSSYKLHFSKSVGHMYQQTIEIYKSHSSKYHIFKNGLGFSQIIWSVLVSPKINHIGLGAQDRGAPSGSGGRAGPSWPGAMSREPNIMPRISR